MKKIFFKEIFLTLIFTFTLFIGLNNVKADTTTWSDFYNNYSDLSLIYSTHYDKIEHLISLWDTYYKSDFPYYFIVYEYDNRFNLPQECIEDRTMCDINLIYSTSPYLSNFQHGGLSFYNSPYMTSSGTIVYDTGQSSFPLNAKPLYIKYNPRSNIYTDFNSSSSFSSGDYIQYIYNSTGHLITLTSNGLIYKPDLGRIEQDITNINIPSYTSGTISYPSINIPSGGLLPDYSSLSGGTYDPSNSSNYTEINLNNYSYVILSLKDYTLRNEDNNQFSTPIYTLGSLCLTPVYNYGMDEKKNYYSDYNVQACSSVYTFFSPVDVYILKNDLVNHSVYYIKAYSSDTNIIKVDNTIFDITYITSENEDNPSVIINGRSYPTIPFSDLTQSANESSENGYVSGQVCAIGDINCQANANGLDISELFSKPLELLETIWDSISTVFTLISSFISILPPTLQAFLYVSFMLIVVLGILRYIL